MLREIDLHKKPQKLKLFLAKPNKQIVSKLRTAYEEELKLKRKEVDELSFHLPLYVEREHKLIKNKQLKHMKQRYLIKAVLGDTVEWFTVKYINSIGRDNEEAKIIRCYSLEHELHGKNIKRYSVVSKNAEELISDMVNDTLWKVGYIDPSFKSMFRSYDADSKKALECVYEIAEKFNGYLIFDSKNRTVNMYVEQDVGINKGFKISHGKYLQELDLEERSVDIVTRLSVYGKDISIQSVNPTGQPYIDDFSYFMYGFKQDEQGNVISSSNGYMSDELCTALVNYNKLLEEKSTDFTLYLSQLNNLNTTLSEKNAQLYHLENERIIILDNLYTAQENEEDTTELQQQLSVKTSEVLTKEDEISDVNNQITQVSNQIKALRNSLSYQSNLSPELYEELQYYICEDDWSDANYIYPEDLFEEGKRKIKERNIPELDINLSIANFLECLTEQRNWDKLALNDVIRVQYERIDVDIKAVLDEIEYDFENSDINLRITNVVGAKTNDERLYRALNDAYSTKRSFDDNRYNWDEIGRKFDNRNNRISDIPNNPTIANDNTSIEHVLNDDGSVNISFEWGYNDHLKTDNNKDNIDGFIVYVKTLGINDKYTFGSSIAKEETYTLDGTKRAIVLTGVPSNKYYSFGVQAYRTVDRDISENGILRSKIIQPTRDNENPYQPMSNVAFNGDITGTINGVTSSTVINQAQNGQQVYEETEKTLRNGNPINAPSIVTNGTAVEHVINDDGSADISFEWVFTEQESSPINGFGVVIHSSTSSTGHTPNLQSDTVIHLDKTNRAFILNGVPANKYYTFAVFAYRNVDTSINSNGVIRSDIVKPSLNSENPYRPSDSVAYKGDIIGTIGGVSYDRINKSPVTIVVASEGSSLNWKQADYVIPIGATNAQTIINQAINSLSTTGGKVSLLEGTYVVNGDIIVKDNIILEGQGVKTKVTPPSLFTPYSIRGINVRDMQFRNVLLHGVCMIFEDMIDCVVDTVTVNETNANGISFRNSKTCKLLNCKVEYGAFNGLILTDCEGFLVTGGKYNYNQRNGIFVTAQKNYITRPNSINNIITLNHCAHNVESGIQLDSNVKHEGYQVENNECSYNGDGVYFSSLSKGSVSANICNHNINDGIVGFQSDHTIVSGNGCSENGRRGLFIGNSENVTININQCIGNSKASSPFGATANIYLNSIISSNIQGNICRRGINENKPSYGIHLGSGSNNIVTNNDLLLSGTLGGFLDQGTNTRTTAGNRV